MHALIKVGHELFIYAHHMILLLVSKYKLKNF